MGHPWEDGLARQLVLGQCFLDPRGRRRWLQRMVVRCEREGAQRLVYASGRTAGGDLPVFDAVSGCSIGRRAVLGTGDVAVVELLLPNPLARGQRWTLQFETGWLALQANRFQVTAGRPAELLIAQVVFDPEDLPREVSRSRGTVHPDGSVVEQGGEWQPLRGRGATSFVPSGQGAVAAVEWRD